MVDTGWCLFLDVAAESISGSRYDWTNPTYALIDDSSSASVYIPESLVGPSYTNYSEFIEFKNPDWPFAILPAPSYNVDFRIKRTTSGGGHYLTDHVLSLIVGGTRTGNNLADGTKWAGDITQDYTGDWGVSLTSAHFNSYFGVALQARNQANSGTGNINAVWMRAQYEPYSGPNAREIIQYS